MVRFQADDNEIVSGAIYIKKGTQLGESPFIMVQVTIDETAPAEPYRHRVWSQTVQTTN